MSQSQVDVATVVGALAGNTLATTVPKHTQPSVHIYEASSELKEQEASIELWDNARRVVHLLGLGDVVDKAGSIGVGSSCLTTGEGPQAGILVRDSGFDVEIVHHGSLLMELISTLSKDEIHLSKRSSSIQDNAVYFPNKTAVRLMGSLAWKDSELATESRRYAP